MKNQVIRVTSLCLVCISSIIVFLFYAQCSMAYEKEIKALAVSMAENIAKSGKKKIAVLDFTDSEGNVTTLGKFFAEELIVALLSTGQEFEIADRTHLQRILQEQKLSVSDLKEPQTVKKLGEIAGIEAVITGTIEESVLLSVNTVDVNTTQRLDTSTGAIVKTQIITELLGTRAEPEKVAVASPKKPEAPKPSDQITGVVITQRDPLNIRDGPGQKHKVVRKAPKGQKLIILDSSAKWYKVQLPDGTVGYGYSKYIKILQENN